MRGNVLSPGDAAHHSAPGPSDRVSVPVQLFDRHGEGHFPGGQHYGDGNVYGDRTYEPLALYIEVGLIYLLFCTVLTKVQRLVEKRMRVCA